MKMRQRFVKQQCGQKYALAVSCAGKALRRDSNRFNVACESRLEHSRDIVACILQGMA